MSLVNNIKSFLVNQENNASIEVPAGFCPNCWGRQEYSGNFYDAMKYEGVNITNIDDKKGWIQDYVNKNLSGIVLQKKDEVQTCSICYTNNNQKQ